MIDMISLHSLLRRDGGLRSTILNHASALLGTYPNDNDKLIIAKRGSMTSGSTYFSSLDEIGSNMRFGLADLTSLYNSSSSYSRE